MTDTYKERATMAETIIAPTDIVARWERYGDLRYRAKRDTQYPCAVCGWGQHMAIHQPITTGPGAGQPCGHSYVAFVPPSPESKP
jgi:hypothetical protein